MTLLPQKSTCPPPKNTGWKTTFPFDMALFLRGYMDMLVFWGCKHEQIYTPYKTRYPLPGRFRQARSAKACEVLKLTSQVGVFTMVWMSGWERLLQVKDRYV